MTRIPEHTGPEGGKGRGKTGPFRASVLNHRQERKQKEYNMKNKPLILATLLGLAFATSPAAFAGSRDHEMSDMQHRKHMGGPRHPEDGHEQTEDGKARPMSGMQHRKHMGGLRHPSDENEE